MPSPVGHLIVGYIVYAALQPQSLAGTMGQRYVLLGTMLSAVAADLDFLPGMALGTPNRFHHGASHSLGAVFCYGMVIWMVLRCCRIARAPRLALLFASAYGSHLLLDFLAADRAPPLGIPPFWPVVSTYYIAPAAVFMDIHRSGRGLLEFLVSLFNAHNLWAIAWEAVLLAPFAIWAQRRMAAVKPGEGTD
jgi:inner membrane protein